MASYYCYECGRITEHLNVSQAARRACVCRGTAYRWIYRALVHSLVHPSGRIFVCADSLLVPGFVRFPGERRPAVPWVVAGPVCSASGSSLRAAGGPDDQDGGQEALRAAQA